ncbi:MAG TPA: trimethylamine methyltransferase family protein, partial [Anaerolineae bacterium]
MSARARRSNRRRERREREIAPVAKAVEPLVNKLPLTEVLSEEGVDAIHRASMRLLKDNGILVIDYPRALETFQAHGARVEGELVQIDEETLLHFVQQAPATFTQLARNPNNTLPVGGRNIIFAPVYGPPFVGDLDRGRRQATLDDFQNFAKLTYMAQHLHHAGGTLVEPNDID